MEQQLRRIKNKDLSTLDERLFGNLDKVETINSTIENLGQFQQFLLKQITQFEQKAKTKNKSKEVTEVIQQNCLTLRESIMNVIPDDLESSRSRMRQTITSPINGFRSTKTNGFLKEFQQQESFRVHESRETELMRRIEDFQAAQKKSLRKQEELKGQIARIKQDYSNLKEKFEGLEIALKKQFEAKLRRQVESLSSQNKKLKEDCKILKEQNSKLSEKLATFSRQSETIRLKNIEKLFQKPLTIEQNQEIQKSHQSSGLKKSIVKQISETQSKELQYMSFKEKMKFDFTSKLHKYENSEIKARKGLGESQNIQGEGSDTFRDSNTIQLGGFDSLCESAKGAYRPIQISSKYDNEFEPNVPNLLKRNSISNQYHSSNVSQQTITSKHRIPLESYDSNLGIRSSYQSAQKPRQDPSSSKKSNHDLMRKTKSNFFKTPIQNKENVQVMESFYDSNIAKMKGLVNQSNPNERKRNSQSKQKLKIFSMI